MAYSMTTEVELLPDLSEEDNTAHYFRVNEAPVPDPEGVEFFVSAPDRLVIPHSTAYETSEGKPCATWPCQGSSQPTGRRPTV
jgi:hypothetical protein